ncbi:MAG TPA: DUF2252 domain-containing protein [Solirubrobacteraceae bacterium]|nr:DUF2252 domain-containing protein [Solirubrobacteraceae bacterium]
MATTSKSTTGGKVTHLTVAERADRGKAARAACPRSSHAAFEPPADRTDPIDLLEAQARTRVPELVPIRYGRMLVSPFTFYRGAAKIMANDLATTPDCGLRAQCCGDAHLSNFGVFASPERRLVFDINDFDETLPGPWEWDVKRLAASMLIAARANAYAPKDQDRIVLDTLAQYRTAMRNFAEMANLEVWYARLDVDSFMREFGSQFKRSQVRRTETLLAKARTKDSMQAFSKLTNRVDGRAEIVDQSPLIVPLRALMPEDQVGGAFEELHKLIRSFRQSLEHDRRILLEQFELADFARKVVGVGSVGTRAWIALLFGRDNSDPLFLQLKEAEDSVLEEYVGKSAYKNHGQRVVTGQRLMQAVSDIFLGWLHVPSGMDGVARDFYGRQLRDWKGSAEIENMTPDGMAAYGRLCGWTLARAHARSGDRIAIASYLGSGPTFDRAILDFSKAYADQNEQDYKALAKAVKSGRVIAQTGL